MLSGPEGTGIKQIYEKPLALWFRTVIFPALISIASWLCVYLFTDFNRKIDTVILAQQQSHESISLLSQQLQADTKQLTDSIALLARQVGDHEIRLRVLEGESRGTRR